MCEWDVRDDKNPLSTSLSYTDPPHFFFFFGGVLYGQGEKVVKKRKYRTQKLLSPQIVQEGQVNQRLEAEGRTVALA